MTLVAPSRPLEQDELEALIEEARRRARRRRRRYGAVVAFAALTLGGSCVLLGRIINASTDTAGGRSRSSATTTDALGAGPFWYTRRISTIRAPEAVQSLVHPGRTPEPVWVDVVRSDETWIGVDGAMRERQVVRSSFASAADRARWRAAGMPPLPNAGTNSDGLNVGDGLFPAQLQFYGTGFRDIGDGLFTYRQLRSLPTRAVLLRARLERAQTALLHREINAAVPAGKRHHELVARSGAAGTRKHRFAISMLTTIGDLLATPIPARTRVALSRVAATIPGVSYTAGVHDSLGRPAVAVTASAAGLSPVRLLLDSTTGVLLGGTSFSEDGTVVAQGAVDSINDLPHAIKPIQASGSRPQPQIPTISPQAGSPDTVFKVMLPAAAQTNRSVPPPQSYALVTGPAGRGCQSYYPWPSFAQLTATGTNANAGNATHTYQLKPPTTGSPRWCAGRYKLEVVAGVPGHPPANTDGIGSAIYFQVR